MTKTRIKVLKYYLSSKRKNIRFKEIISFLFGASYNRKANKIIISVNQNDQFKEIKLKGCDSRLFYPVNFSITSLKQVIVESFYKNNWHYYEIPETKVEKNDIVIDCGVAEGLFGLLVKSRCRHVYMI